MGKFAAGRLRHRIELQRQVTTINSAGESVIEWQHYADRWAEVVDLSGNALLLAQQIQSEIRTRITVRYDAQIIESMRALWRTFVFDIKAVQNDPDSALEFMTLMCGRGVSNG